MTNDEALKFVILDDRLGELLEEYQRISGRVWPHPGHKQAQLVTVAVKHRDLARQRNQLLG